MLEPMECVGFRLRRANRAITSFFDRRLRETGVRGTQWPVLAGLAQMGRVPLGRLAEVLGMDASTVSRSVQPLVRQGWVRLEDATEASRRQRFAALTRSGTKKFEEARAVWAEAQRDLLAVAGSEWPAVVETLDRLERQT